MKKSLLHVVFILGVTCSKKAVNVEAVKTPVVIVQPNPFVKVPAYIHRFRQAQPDKLYFMKQLLMYIQKFMSLSLTKAINKTACLFSSVSTSST